MRDIEPIQFRPRPASALGSEQVQAGGATNLGRAVFDRRELDTILSVYGRKVAAGEWRDYAIDFHPDKAVFSVFRRASEVPLYRIEKTPKLARRQGAYSVVAAGGLVLKRGPDLRRVLSVLEKRISAID